jgi:hypothetical protein
LSKLTERPDGASDDSDTLAWDERRLVREAKDLPATIVEPDANVPVVRLRTALAHGGSSHGATRGADDRSRATTASDRSAEEPTDERAGHCPARWIPLPVHGGLPDPGDLTQPFGRRANPGGGTRLGGGAGHQQYEHPCYEVTFQKHLLASRTGSQHSLARRVS